MAEQEEQHASSETVRGGRYVVGDQVVDANGKPVPGWTVQDGVAMPPAPKGSKKDPEPPKTGE